MLKILVWLDMSNNNGEFETNREQVIIWPFNGINNKTG